MLRQTKKEIREFLDRHLDDLKKDAREFGLFDLPEDEFESYPGLDLTIGYDPKDGSWNFQTGDNSFTGNAYGCPIWGVCVVCEDSTPGDLAETLIDDIEDQEFQ